jgi:biofilm PGA synthesis N-glycosyltransferase PgaC
MVLVTVLLTVWFILLVVLLTGWRATMRREIPQGTGKEPLISVVVAARNESKNIGRLLSALAAQNYRNFEIIVVDDGSDDDTVTQAQALTLPNLVVLPNKGAGKKAAITTGVGAAKGSIIAMTDADCIVPTDWLKTIRAAFRDKRVSLAFGGVRMEAGSLFDAMQAIEFASLVGSAAATAGLGKPTMCNAANLAFRRNAFNAVGGYRGNQHIPTGDDEFLMRSIQKRFPRSVAFIPAADGVVTTRPAPDISTFFHQRRRWASKWRFNSPTGQLLAIYILCLQIGVVTNIALIFSPFILQAVFLFAVKMILEAAFLLQVCRFLSVKWSWLAFLLLQPLYPLYVIGVAFSSLFTGYSWKERTFEPV